MHPLVVTSLRNQSGTLCFGLKKASKISFVKRQTDTLLWFWPHCACVDGPHTSSVYDPLPLVSAHWSYLRMAPAIIVYIWVLTQVNLYYEKFDTSFHIVLFMGHVLPFCDWCVETMRMRTTLHTKRACSKVWARTHCAGNDLYLFVLWLYLWRSYQLLQHRMIK